MTKQTNKQTDLFCLQGDIRGGLSDLFAGKFAGSSVGNLRTCSAELVVPASKVIFVADTYGDETAFSLGLPTSWSTTKEHESI